MKHKNILRNVTQNNFFFSLIKQKSEVVGTHLLHNSYLCHFRVTYTYFNYFMICT